ncbi:MAG: TIGR00725 family protein [Candidatus Aminicenantes bacterium]
MMRIRDRIRVGVIGGADPAEEWLQTAFEIGRLIAERGAVLVCGGLSGVMEAAAKGAKQAGGLTLGILPGNSPNDANPYIDISVATGMGYTRNSLVAMNADILIAVNGQYGTLTEVAYGFIYEKKIIGLGTWNIKGIQTAASAEEAVNLALRG